ncbi:hypothetical protein ILUMI_18789, partial [Ignelater luminosus]
NILRTYIRKTEKRAGYAYSAENLKAAIDDIKHGNKSFRGTSQFYNIPKTTLMHHVKGTREVKGRIADDSREGGGVKAYLPSEVEEEIANCLKILDLADMRCRLSIKKPQSVEHIRIGQTNPWVVYDYFEKLTKIVNDLQLNGKPQQIYNCDETSFCHDPSKTKTVQLIPETSEKRAPQEGKIRQPCYVVQQVEKCCQTAVSVTERGWMETILFHNWFRDVFLKNISPHRPVLLIYDGHVTHISVELIKLAQENQVTIIKLPPHTTHVLQPLDVTVFKELKTKWDKELCKWQRKHSRKKILKDEFIVLLSKVAKKVPSASILNGFATTGIYDPEIQGLNKAAIPLSVFKTTDLKRYNEQLQCSKLLPITEEDLEKKSTKKKPEKEGNEKEEQQEKSSKKVDKKDVPETVEDISIASTSKDKTS